MPLLPPETGGFYREEATKAFRPADSLTPKTMTSLAIELLRDQRWALSVQPLRNKKYHFHLEERMQEHVWPWVLPVSAIHPQVSVAICHGGQ